MNKFIDIKELVDLVKQNKDYLVLEIIMLLIGISLERIFEITKLPKKIWDYVKMGKEGRKETKKAAVEELYPILEELEEGLNSIENLTLNIEINEMPLNQGDFISKVEELVKINGKLDKFLDRVSKPKNLRKKMKKNRIKKTFFEEIYDIKSSVDTIEMLSYVVLESIEEHWVGEEDFKSQIENFNIETKKTLDQIHKTKTNYKEYYVKYKI